MSLLISYADLPFPDVAAQVCLRCASDHACSFLVCVVYCSGELGDDALATSEGVRMLKLKHEGLQRTIEELVRQSLIQPPHSG